MLNLFVGYEKLITLTLLLQFTYIFRKCVKNCERFDKIPMIKQTSCLGELIYIAAFLINKYNFLPELSIFQLLLNSAVFEK